MSFLPTGLSVRILFFKEYMTYIICKLLPIKKPQQRYKIKKLLCKATGKCRIKHEEEPWDRRCAFEQYGEGNG